MIDALYPALRAYREGLDAGRCDEEIIQDFMEGAAKRCEAYKGNGSCKRGRASYRSDKGVGHLDPGAVLRWQCSWNVWEI